MKNFKNKINIKGSLRLLKAMKEELVEMGYTSERDFSAQPERLVVNTDHNGKTWITVPSFDNSSDWLQFTLPQDWDEVLTKASETNEITRDPKVGDYIVFLKEFDGKEKGFITKITSIYEEESLPSNLPAKFWINYKEGGFRYKGSGYFLNIDFRYATPEEIHERVFDGELLSKLINELESTVNIYKKLIKNDTRNNLFKK